MPTSNSLVPLACPAPQRLKIAAHVIPITVDVVLFYPWIIPTRDGRRIAVAHYLLAEVVDAVFFARKDVISRGLWSVKGEIMIEGLLTVVQLPLERRLRVVPWIEGLAEVVLMRTSST